MPIPSHVHSTKKITTPRRPSRNKAIPSASTAATSSAGPDRHRQDGGLRAAHPAAPAATAAGACAPSVVTPTRELCAQIDESRRLAAHPASTSSSTAASSYAPGREPVGARRRPRDRHARPPARHDPAPTTVSQGRDRRPRRSRPHARHGLLARRCSASSASCRTQAPDPALLGHHVARPRGAVRDTLRDPVRDRRGRHAGRRDRAAVYPVDRDQKTELLVALLRHHKPQRVPHLHAHQAPCRPLVEQPRSTASRPTPCTPTTRRSSARTRARGLHDRRVRVLVATDIAARGIDVDGISHVVNYDFPNARRLRPPHRPHRARRRRGRGDLAGRGGEEIGYLRDIERLIRIALPREDRRTPGGNREQSAAPAPHRADVPSPRAPALPCEINRGTDRKRASPTPPPRW